MAVKFLSEEWATAVEEKLNAHTGFKQAIAGAELGLQFVVTEAADGDVHYYLKATGGSARLAVGKLDGADVTVSQSYDTASSIARGETNVQMAFISGKVKPSGNLAKLMMHQKAFGEWQEAVSGLAVEY